MTGAFQASLHFAVHLLALTVSLGAAFVIFGDRDERGASRTAGGIALLGLAAGEALHGAGFAGDLASVPTTLRIAAYALFIVYGLAGARAAHPAAAAAPAALAFPGRAVPAAVAALVAAAATVGRRRDGRHGALAGALALLGAAEALLMLRPEIDWAFDGYHWLRTGGFLLAGGFIMLSTRRSIQFRIIAGFVGLLLIVVLAISVTVTQIVGANLRDGALARVEAQSFEVRRGLNPLIGDKVSTLLAFGNSESVQRRIRRGRSVPRRSLESFRSRLVPDLDFMIVLGRRGQVLGTTGIKLEAALEIVGTDLVDGVVTSELENAGIDAFGRRRLALIGAAPILAERQRVLGFVVAGLEVDQSFLNRFPIPTGTRLAVFLPRRPQPVADLGFRSDPRAPGLLPTGVLGSITADVSQIGGSERRSIRLGGAPHFASFVPLLRPDGSMVAILMAAEPAAVLGETERAVNRVIFLVTVGVVGLAFLASVYVGRRISRPVRALTGAARRVQEGDLEAKAPVGGVDEVGDLARTFNRMTDSIAVMTGDLREAAAEQARLRGRLETTVNSMSDGLLAVDGDGIVVTCNQAAAEILGQGAEDTEGRHLRESLTLLGPEHEEIHLDGELPAGETTFVRQTGGRDVPVAISSGELRGDDGQPLGHVYVLRDMTREHEIERMKSEFLSNVSHELRTPLTPIIGYSEILQRREVPKARAAEFATGILQSAKRLERIVAMLVDFSAMEGGRLAIAAEPVPVRPLVTEVLDEWRERTDRHEIEAEVPGDLPDALADVQLVRRTLDELLDNAVKYSPDGGTITVSVAPQNSARRRMLRFDVSDEGIGIEPDELPGIFEDFRQVDASDTRTFGGLGLGLAFVKRLVEAQGGLIEVVSAPGEGATFTFTVPAADTGARRKS